MDKLAKATEAASLAIEFDKARLLDESIECYNTAWQSLIEYLEINYSNVPPDVRAQYEHNIKQYKARADALVSENLLQQFNLKLSLARGADAQNKTDEAIKHYADVVEIALKNKLNKSDAKIKKLIAEALVRAETLKGITPKDKSCVNIPYNPVSLSAHVNQSNTKSKPSGQNYTKEEIDVLRHTSTINNNVFLPFMEQDLKEKFNYNLTGVFEDPEGTLTLASKQMREFERWIRPEELCRGIGEPRMIAGSVDCNAVKQTIISDCSFIASLTVSAQYEEKFKKKIITSIIYPRNSRDEPCYNPYGKYMIMLHINGIRRKIIIDDRLPYSRYGQILCSYSSNRTEYWVSFLEKAYMKVMGGYDFPGSNSNTDLHALTGWIPERCPIQREESTFNREELFNKIFNNYQNGRILVTAATGPLDTVTEQRTGLAASHAYAVLDVKNVLGIKLLQLKNPWSHTEWKGNYSDNSTLWTEELKSLLNVKDCSDDGLFWIDYRSVIEFFDVFYLNWNPDLFSYKYSIHEKWDANIGPTKDLYNVGENPQYSLEVKGNGEVWLLLTRHITRIEDFRDNQEYITLLVYKTKGRRVYYPHDPPPFINGVRINSPHYLIKLKSNESSLYTLVMSQYEKTTTTYYTLRAYGTCAYQLKKLHIYPFYKSIRDEWSPATAGGCENNHATYNINPKFIITVPDSRTPCDMVIELKGPRQYEIGFSVKVHSLEDPSITAPFHTLTAGQYRSGFVVLDLPGLPAGRYIVTVATFTPGQIGNFFLDIRATANISIARST